jgi:hypothetical protein
MTDLVHHHPENVSTTSCPACMAPVIPHVWTEEQIIELRPVFGESSGWFYGLVTHQDDEGEAHVELAEIFPGMGWSCLDVEDIATDWKSIERDLRVYRPERFGGAA